MRMNTNSTLVRRGLLVLGLLTLSCTRPGPRLAGSAAVYLGGPEPMHWSGPCVYDISTRWATSVPHSLTLSDDQSDMHVAIYASRSFRPGHREFPTYTGGAIQAFVKDGATIHTAVKGRLDVVRVGDSTFIAIVGSDLHEDEIPFEAECSLGPLAAP